MNARVLEPAVCARASNLLSTCVDPAEWGAFETGRNIRALLRGIGGGSAVSGTVLTGNNRLRIEFCVSGREETAEDHLRQQRTARRRAVEARIGNARPRIARGA